jgi:hypothetical protein
LLTDGVRGKLTAAREKEQLMAARRGQARIVAGE